jgi:hypothetical protein
MENRAILEVYLAIWLVYLVGIYAYSIWRRKGVAIATCSHLVPSSVALSMAYIFLIKHGATVAQFVAGDERGFSLWSTWVHLWPLLLLAAFLGGIVHVVWTIAACFIKKQRAWLPISVAGAAMCIFAFFTVGSNFPDA